jgi:hypothetical protein
MMHGPIIIRFKMLDVQSLDALFDRVTGYGSMFSSRQVLENSPEGSDRLWASPTLLSIRYQGLP